MNRKAIEKWLAEHPTEVQGVPAELVEECEQAVRRYAAKDTWQSAKFYVEGRLHDWEQEWGFHASESSVAREICAKLSRELAKHEPDVKPGTEVDLIGEEILGQLGPEARAVVSEWVLELAREVEHRIWQEIVRFTKKEGRKLVAEGRVSTDDSWEGGENYSRKAVHVAELVLEDYSRQSSES